MSYWTEVFRILEQTGNVTDQLFGVELIHVGRPEDDAVESEYDDDDTYLLEPWGWTLVTVAGAMVIAACVFYFTYKYHLCQARNPDEDSVGELDLESGKTIATKPFDNSLACEPQGQRGHDSGSEDTEHSDSPTGTTGTVGVESAYNNLQHLASAPRCVLCSKAFEIGENVTQSNACHHEYHENCLVKHWKKPKQNSGSCPVCKVEYVVEEVAPSKHYSESFRRMSNSERIPEPFEK